MIDIPPSGVVGNDRMTSSSYLRQALTSLPYRPNMQVDATITQGPTANTSLANGDRMKGPDAGAQISASCTYTQYVATEGREKYRPEIAQLYCDDNKTASEVQAIMKSRYGFNAT